MPILTSNNYKKYKKKVARYGPGFLKMWQKTWQYNKVHEEAGTGEGFEIPFKGSNLYNQMMNQKEKPIENILDEGLNVPQFIPNEDIMDNQMGEIRQQQPPQIDQGILGDKELPVAKENSEVNAQKPVVPSSHQAEINNMWNDLPDIVNESEARQIENDVEPEEEKPMEPALKKPRVMGPPLRVPIQPPPAEKQPPRIRGFHTEKFTVTETALKDKIKQNLNKFTGLGLLDDKNKFLTFMFTGGTKKENNEYKGIPEKWYTGLDSWSKKSDSVQGADFFKNNRSYPIAAVQAIYTVSDNSEYPLELKSNKQFLEAGKEFVKYATEISPYYKKLQDKTRKQKFIQQEYQNFESIANKLITMGVVKKTY